MREASASLKFALEFSSRDLIMMSDRSKRLTILFLWKVHIPHWSRLWTTGINPSAFRLKQSCITPWESLPILEREKPCTFFLVLKLKINYCKYLLLHLPLSLSVSASLFSALFLTILLTMVLRVFLSNFSWWCLVWGARQEKSELGRQLVCSSLLLDIRPHF